MNAAEGRRTNSTHGITGSDLRRERQSRGRQGPFRHRCRGFISGSRQGFGRKYYLHDTPDHGRYKTPGWSCRSCRQRDRNDRKRRLNKYQDVRGAPTYWPRPQIQWPWTRYFPDSLAEVRRMEQQSVRVGSRDRRGGQLPTEPLGMEVVGDHQDQPNKAVSSLPLTDWSPFISYGDNESAEHPDTVDPPHKRTTGANGVGSRWHDPNTDSPRWSRPPSRAAIPRLRQFNFGAAFRSRPPARKQGTDSPPVDMGQRGRPEYGCADVPAVSTALDSRLVRGRLSERGHERHYRRLLRLPCRIGRMTKSLSAAGAPVVAACAGWWGKGQPSTVAHERGWTSPRRLMGGSDVRRGVNLPA